MREGIRIGDIKIELNFTINDKGYPKDLIVAVSPGIPHEVAYFLLCCAARAVAEEEGVAIPENEYFSEN